MFCGSIGGWIHLERQKTVAAEQARLEREGIEREKAAAIAAKEAEMLRRMELPLPQSGIYSIAPGVRYALGDSPPLLIHNAPDSSVLMKLVRTDSGAEVLSVFIRHGETIKIKVPLGSYKAKIAAGETWYGDSIRFGPSTSYGVLDTTLDFYIEGDHLMGHEITLERVKNGNLSQLPLSASDF